MSNKMFEEVKESRDLLMLTTTTTTTTTTATTTTTSLPSQLELD